MTKLSFSNSNRKIGKEVYTFNLPAGHTCPFADICHSKADKNNGKITDGETTVFRCYAASQEVLYANVRKSRWENYEVLKAIGKNPIGLADIINDSLPKKAKIVRIHSSGDFFTQEYFDAWLIVAKNNPNVLFYAYTKSLRFWVKRLTNIPKNFVLTASKGGKEDLLIDVHNLRYSEVVYSIEQANSLGLEIDKNDILAQTNGNSFALLIHGTQPKGTKASEAKIKLEKEGLIGIKHYQETLKERFKLSDSQVEKITK